MSGFSASPAAPASPAGSKITAGPFWPAVDINAFRDAMRIGDQSIPHARVAEALRGAIIHVDDNLADWQATQLAAGRETLAAVPAMEIDGESRLGVLFRSAVHAFAAADLIETHRDALVTKSGADRAEQQAMTPGDHRRNAIHAIRTMRGERRTAVELI